MIRFFDLFFSIIGLLFLFPILTLFIIIGYFVYGSPIFRQIRVGFKQRPFLLYKLRTMPIDTISIATHLVDENIIPPFGKFLRYFKFDEIPQLFNILIGDMSIVGPRPCLFNQKKLITERKKRKVFKVKPGITGLAQVSAINMKNPSLLSKTDLKMIREMNLYYYFYYILKTLLFILKKRT